jgi:hypothetical protein
LGKALKINSLRLLAFVLHPYSQIDLKKILLYLLRAFIILAAIFGLVWVFFFAYLTFNKNKIISKVKSQLNQQIKGNISIGDLRPDFFHAFPYLSIKISNVIIRDSLWSHHHHDFVNAQNLYIRLKPLSLFSQTPSVGNITIENATICFYTDSTGYTNIVKAEPVRSGEKKEIPDFLFTNTRFIIQDENKHKLHDIYCERLKCGVNKEQNFTRFGIKLKSLVHNLSFNTKKGSFLHEKDLEGKFELLWKNKKSLEFSDVNLKIDKQAFSFSGNFVFDEQPTFKLAIETKKIYFEKAVPLLPESIQQKLKNYKIDQPFPVNANISGSLAILTMPLVTINFETKKAHITTPPAEFNGCAFAASFTNQFVNQSPPSDVNSKIFFKNFSGNWENISLKSDSVIITNLITPFISCDLRSVFDLKQLNELSGSSTMQFMQGKGDMTIHYKASLINDSLPPTINGNIVLKNAELSYLPRHFSLNNCNGTVEFKDQDIFIKKLSAMAGSNQLVMNGSVINLLTLLNEPENLTINWNIYSPDLDINNFISYIGKRSAVPINNSSKRVFFKIADKIDRMLKDGTANLLIQAAHLSYKKFSAKNVLASIFLLQNKIVLNEVRLAHAGGSISFNGSLTDEATTNTLNFSGLLDRVNISEVFHSFSNFGQDAITEKNMKGILSANVVMSALLTDKATIVENSLAAKIDFNIQNGELINFEPVEKISETAFKKRDFSNLRFAELKNSLEINGSAIKIPNMEIHSNVLTLFVQGVYDVKKGTDMSIRVPVSNLKKPEPEVIPINKNKTGISIRLRAKTGEDGKLKVTWDPFNKSSKANSAKTKALQQ